jgi:hypothetical protein
METDIVLEVLKATFIFTLLTAGTTKVSAGHNSRGTLGSKEKEKEKAVFQAGIAQSV